MKINLQDTGKSMVTVMQQIAELYQRNNTVATVKFLRLKLS